MTLLATKEDIHTEILSALNKIKNEANISDNMLNPHFEPVAIPLNSEGETLIISCRNITEFFKGESSLVLKYIVPHESLDVDDANCYVKEVHDSEALDMVYSVINEVFDVSNIRFMHKNTTMTTYCFTEYISLNDPTIAPTEDDYEITPVLTVNIEKKYIHSKKSQSTVLQADTDGVDMIINPNLDAQKVEFDETVNLFGTDLTVKLANGDNLGSTIALENNGVVYGYVSELGGDWNYLIDANGMYPDGSMF